MNTLLLILQLMPSLLRIIEMIQQARLTAQATKEMMADLEQTADYLVTRTELARAKVKDTPDEIANDPNNRD